MAAATTPKQAPIPALIPVPDPESPLFWPVIALNDDAEAQALQALRLAAVKQAPTAANHTTRIALIGAMNNLEVSTTSAFRNARDEGVLLYAWRGSKAFAVAAGAEGCAA